MNRASRTNAKQQNGVHAAAAGSVAASDSVADSPLTERVLSAKELFAGTRRVWIEHADQRYLLQLTRTGKLILTK